MWVEHHLSWWNSTIFVFTYVSWASTLMMKFHCFCFYLCQLSINSHDEIPLFLFLPMSAEHQLSWWNSTVFVFTYVSSASTLMMKFHCFCFYLCQLSINSHDEILLFLFLPMWVQHQLSWWNSTVFVFTYVSSASTLMMKFYCFCFYLCQLSINSHDEILLFLFLPMSAEHQLSWWNSTVFVFTYVSWASTLMMKFYCFCFYLCQLSINSHDEIPLFLFLPMSAEHQLSWWNSTVFVFTYVSWASPLLMFGFLTMPIYTISH